MKIAIDYAGAKENFCTRFEAYCQRHDIDYKLVDCTSGKIIEELADCDALVWHWPHADHKFELFARQLTYSLQAAGKVVFPNAATCWHFDDKIGQKYLFESLELPLVPTYVFYEKAAALDFLEKTDYPVVFKLKSGAGSSNVKLIRNKRCGRKLVKKMFGKGFPAVNRSEFIRDTYKKFRQKKLPFRAVLSAIKAAILNSRKLEMREYGYVYMQKFIADNEYDIRAIVIGDKVFEIKRLCRPDDFRASGSGTILYEKSELSGECAGIALAAAAKLKTQCAALDFVFDHGKPMLVEISYGFSMHGYDRCTGYWDADLNWHAGVFNPQDWIMDLVVKEVKNLKNNAEKTH